MPYTILSNKTQVVINDIKNDIMNIFEKNKLFTTIEKLKSENQEKLDILTNGYWEKYIENIQSEYSDCINYIPNTLENEELIKQVKYYLSVIDICDYVLNN